VFVLIRDSAPEVLVRISIVLGNPSVSKVRVETRPRPASMDTRGPIVRESSVAVTGVTV